MIKIEADSGRHVTVMAWATHRGTGKCRCAICGELKRDTLTVSFGNLCIFVCVDCTSKSYTDTKAFEVVRR